MPMKYDPTGKYPVDRTHAAVQALSQTWPDRYFRRGGVAVEVIGDTIVPVTSASLLAALDAAICYEGATGGPRRLPSEDRQAVHQWIAEHGPELRGLARHPIVRPDGTIADRRGYDVLTGLYIAWDALLPTVDLATVLDVVGRIMDFAHASPADRAHALGMVLLPLVRAMIAGPTPMHVVSAQREGAGKTYQAMIPAIIAGDQAVRGLDSWDSEARRQIAAYLLSDPAVLVLDNLPKGALIANPDMLRYLTCERAAIRPIGSPREITIDIRTVWVGTGIDIDTDVDPEMARRCVPIRILHDPSRPRRTEDLHGWIREHRGLVIACLLYLVQHWIALGRPAPARSLPSYVAWSAVVGGIVSSVAAYGHAWLDPSHRPTSGEDRDWAVLFGYWTQPLYPSGVLDLAQRYGLKMGADPKERREQTKIGHTLRNLVDSGRVIGGYRLNRSNAKNGTCYFPVRDVPTLQIASNTGSAEPAEPAEPIPGDLGGGSGGGV